MVTVPLVENSISHGQTLLGRLRREGVIVRVACWIKPREEDRWTLYIASPSVDEKGKLGAYQQLIPVLRSLGDDWITSSDVTLVGEQHPLVRDALDILRRFPHTAPIRSPLTLLGGVPVQEVYVYPPGEVEVTIYHLIFPGAPGVSGILSLDPALLNRQFSMEVDSQGRQAQGQTGVDCVIAAPEGATLERDEMGMMVLAWNLNGRPMHSSANTVWSLADLGLHGFRVLREPGTTRTSA